MTKKLAEMFPQDDLYQLVDMLGFEVNFRKEDRPGADGYVASGGSILPLNIAGLTMHSTASIVESLYRPHTCSTAAIMVQVAGNLNLLFVHSLNQIVTEVFVLDRSKLPRSLFSAAWSRLWMMRDIKYAVRGHFQLIDSKSGGRWVETPKAKKFVTAYVRLRDIGMDSTSALEAAHAVGFGALDEEDKEALRKWKMSTATRRAEILAAAMAEAA